jgi:hypothetical protein|tara:strand:+ start:1565 stop:1747 length:183 start_codon:yes stop_codon:yes gene_type:complete
MTKYIGENGEQTSFEAVIQQSENTVQQSVEIFATNNCVSAGPITIGASATVLVSGVWVIV